jgi:hypothetical protein
MKGLGRWKALPLLGGGGRIGPDKEMFYTSITMRGYPSLNSGKGISALSSLNEILFVIYIYFLKLI